MQAEWQKIIVHVDMDAFFASVEQLMHPEWRGKPVIVGADPRKGLGRGVVSAASYEARKFGVHSAMPISKAYKLCPNAIFAPPNGKAYSEYSNRIFDIFKTLSPIIEPLSIDEAFMDFSGTLKLYQKIELIGEKIKSEIKNQTGLTASVGIAPSKSVAKIASDFDKPDGLTIIRPADVQNFLDELPVSRLWGVGKRMQDSLKRMGIKTVKQLRSYPLEVLENKFGKMGIHIYRMARGDDQREVYPAESVKSVSNETTFGKDVTDLNLVRRTLFTLSEKVCGRLRRKGLKGKTVHIKIRFSDFKTFTRNHSMETPTNLTQTVFEIALFLLNEFDPLQSSVRLIGVGISNLSSGNYQQMTIWDMENDRKLKVEKLMDKIQDKYGKEIIYHAEALKRKSK